MDLAPTPYDAPFQSDVLPDGTALLNGQYVIERYLSSGGFGITYFARDSLDRRVVIKECFPEAYCSRKNRTVLARSQSSQGEFKSIVDMFVREAHSIAKLSHPNIVGVHQVFQDNETAYMALDLIDGKDLLDTIEAMQGRPSYEEANAILLKLLDAISTVHGQDMLHRDISPDNILIDASDNPVLIDFGAAREEASKKSRALSAILVVKDGYSPQEFYIAGSQQTPCSDLYALAATFFHLITGEAPPNSQMRLAALASNKDDPYQPLTGRIKNYPRPFLEAIDTAMNVFPQDRIQSADDWLLRIDPRRRSAAALADAQNDKEIEKTVLNLIQCAQREAELVTKNAPEVPQDIPAPHEPIKQACGPQPAREPLAQALKEVEDPRDAPETAEGLVPINQALPVAPQRVRIKERESDWIARCREKRAAECRFAAEEEAEEPEVPTPKRSRSSIMLFVAAIFVALSGGALFAEFYAAEILEFVGTTSP